jgi:hypothetical protein
MRKNLDYGLLHAMTAFVRVVDAGSFTAAALQMELTTAQMSRLVVGSGESPADQTAAANHPAPRID